jgi:serine/threonine-protein kinase
VLSPDGAVLVDFGIARAIAQSEGDRVTRSGFVVGTEEYMSPEQATGAADIDGRTDLYSLGIVLYEAVTGRPPFSGPTPSVVIDMQQHHEPQDLRRLRPDLPADFAAAITRALKKRPTERWSAAEDMRQALLPFSRPAG